MAYNVNGLSAYVKENEAVLTKDAILGTEGGETIPVISKALGVRVKRDFTHLLLLLHFRHQLVADSTHRVQPLFQSARLRPQKLR